MFTNLCLVLLLLLAGSLPFRNFIFNYRKKAKKRSRKRSNILEHSTIGRRRDGFSSALCSMKQIENLAAGATVLAQLFTLIEHTLSINVSVRYMRTLL